MIFNTNYVSLIHPFAEFVISSHEVRSASEIRGLLPLFLTDYEISVVKKRVQDRIGLHFFAEDLLAVSSW